MKKRIILFILLILLGIETKAMVLKPTGSLTAKEGEEVTVYITLERNASEQQVSAISGIMSWDNDFLTLSNESLLMSNWTSLGTVTNNGKFGYGNLNFDNLISSTSVNIVKLTFIVNSNVSGGSTTISVTNSKATDETGNGITPTNGTHTINITREASSVNTLSSLTLSSGTINFNPNTTTYNVSVANNVSSISISSSLTDATSSYVDGHGNRTVNLTVGNNEVLIKVKAENGDIKTYTINITRQASGVNTLSSLTLSSGTINFNPNTTTYNVSVANNVSSISISSSLTDATSSYVDGYGNRNVNLTVGNNEVLIKVKSATGDIKTYTINITREASSVNTLSFLTLSSGTINFNPNTTTYNVSVANNVSSISISSSLTDAASSYVDGHGNRTVNLTVGNNEVLIKVKSATGDIKTYTINITREASGVNTLSSLTLSSGTINFNPNETEYSISVANDISKITINSQLSDVNASYVSGYEGNLEVELKEGVNKVLIKVKAENDDIKTYTINITRESLVSDVVVNDITIDDYPINFKSNILEYNLEIEEETTLNFNVILENTNYNYEIIGNENLIDGSVIIIRVTGNNDTIEYKFNITKKVLDDETNDNNDNDIVDVPKTDLDVATIIVISGVVIGFIGIFVVFKSGILKSKNK